MSRSFRSVALEDADLLLGWRNDSLTRKMSMNEEVISREDHITWLTHALSDPDSRLYLYIDQAGKPIGHIRSVSHLLSWVVSPEERNRGAGEQMLKEFVRLFPADYTAQVKRENRASAILCKRAGFLLSAENEMSHIFTIRAQFIRDLKLLDEIEKVRSKNNVNWMGLLRIALQHSPEETKKVIQKIQTEDANISALFKRLGEEM